MKLTNAAHFEVIPRRILGAAHAYAGQTFTPAGAAAASGVVTPPLTALQAAVREASEQVRIAWTMGQRANDRRVELADEIKRLGP